MPRTSVHSLDGFTVQLHADKDGYLSIEAPMTIEFVSDELLDGEPRERFTATLSGELREHVGKLLAVDMTYPPLRELADKIAAAQELQDDVVSAAQIEDALEDVESPQSDEELGPEPRCRRCGARDGEPCEKGVGVDTHPKRLEDEAAKGCVVAIRVLAGRNP